MSSFDTTIDVGVRVNVGLAGFLADGGKLTSLTINGRPAKQDQETGGCTLALGVTNSSRVDMTVVADDKADACSTAVRAARLVEPKLPVVG